MAVNQRTKGILLMLGASLSFCVTFSLVRHAIFIDPYKTTLFRFVIGLGLLGTASLAGWIRLRFVNNKFLLLRGLIGGTAVFIVFLTIPKLGISKGTVIPYSYPVFATIFSAIFLKEKIGRVKALAVIAAILGIYLLTIKKSGDSHILWSIGKYEIIAIFGASLMGLAVVIVRYLHGTDDSYAIFFAQCAIGIWVVIVPANLVPISIGLGGGILLLCIGIAGATGQLLMTQGYRYLEVSTGALLGMLVPVLNFFIGALVFKEHLSILSVFGSAIVILSCVAVLIINEKQ
jgi:drug/metabolite transporter (DMT)-like permease